MPTKVKALTCAWAVLFTALVLALAVPQRAAAQDGDDPPSRVARLSYMQGSVSFQPAGESDWVLATVNRPLTTGDKLWIDDGSRAELHIGSAAMRLGSMTGFSFLNLDDRTVQIQLSAGTLYIRVSHLDRDDNFEVDTPNQAFSLIKAGRYRIDASEDGKSTLVAVYEGEGEASGADRTYTVESSERATLTGTGSLEADIDRIDARDRDDFDQWCEMRDRRDERSRSAKYVSPELVGYEDLDDNGTWQHDFEYGDIWVPTAIPAGWAPYHNGHWAWITPWGWTWVDDASWGYAPFHYGRWVYTRRAWAWVPGPVGVTPVYAPALVAFVGTPHFSISVGIGQTAAVGWFPLGPREVYVPSYQVSREYVNRVNVSNTRVNSVTVTNVYNTTVINNVNSTHVTQINYVNRSAPGGVTAVSEGTFRSAQPVARAAVTVNERELRGSPVITRAEVTPTRNSVFGDSDDRRRTAPMPPRIVERQVVAKTAPPPPSVSFERQASALASHPGRPLGHNEVETLRPVNAEAAHSMVRQAPARQAEIPDRNRPDTNRADRDRIAGPPAANSGRRNGQPGNSPGRGLGDRPANGAPAELTPANMPRNDRPASAQPENRGRFGNQPDSQPNNRPGNGQNRDQQPNPATGGQQFGKQPTQPVNPAASPANVPSRNDRPASAQPENRGRFGNQPDSQPNNRPAQPSAPPNNRFSNSQPGYQPPTAPASRPMNMPAASAPAASAPAPEPRRAAPNPPPPPPAPAAAAPRPAAPVAAPSPPAPAHNQSPAAARAPSPAPPPAGGNVHPNGNKDKDDKKKN